jgi:imidazolonepropionase-like amidohydrolase
MTRHLALTALLITGTLAPQSPQRGEALLFEAPRLVVAPGVVLEDQALLVRDGRVALVGPEIPEDARGAARRIPLEGTVVPAFVNPHTHLSLGDDLAERVTALTPDLMAVDAFDPFDELLLRNAQAGVMTMCLAPLSANTFAGVSAVVRAGEMGQILADAAYLKVALVAESNDPGRFPTSRMGSAELIRQSFAAARRAGPAATTSERALRRALDGATRVAVHARDHRAIEAALELCAELGTAPLLIGADECGELLDRMAAASASVILAPLRPSDRREALELPARLERAGISFSFMADSPPSPPAPPTRERPMEGLPPGVEFLVQSAPAPTAPAHQPGHPENARLSAALAVRNGASRTAALAALTTVPAEQCGVAEQCGALRQGQFADFAVWSGDPIDLTSRLLAVYAGGRHIDTATAAAHDR